MVVKTTTHHDSSTQQFLNDVVIPKLESLEMTLATLVTRDALELALLKERVATAEVIDKKITNAFRPWLKVFWIILTPIIGALVTLTVIGQIVNQGRLGQ